MAARWGGGMVKGYRKEGGGGRWQSKRISELGVTHFKWQQKGHVHATALLCAIGFGLFMFSKRSNHTDFSIFLYRPAFRQRARLIVTFTALSLYTLFVSRKFLFCYFSYSNARRHSILEALYIVY